MPIKEVFDLSPVEQRELRDERNRLRARVAELEHQLDRRADFIQSLRSLFGLLDTYGLDAVMPDPDNPLVPLISTKHTPPKRVMVRDVVLAVVERYMKKQGIKG